MLLPIQVIQFHLHLLSCCLHLTLITVCILKSCDRPKENKNCMERRRECKIKRGKGVED